MKKDYWLVANYERNPDYFYRDFWKTRKYEHLAEVIALERLLKKIETLTHKEQTMPSVALDLGGGFGRLIPILREYFDTIVLGDYSTKEIKSGEDIYAKYPPKSLIKIALNAYRLPFRSNTFGTIVSFRLVHHIVNLKEFLQESYRVLFPGGYMILEFAHKDHMKAILRALLKGDFNFFRKRKIKQKHNPFTAQGLSSKKGKIFFYNYSYHYVVSTASSVGFNLIDYLPVSFFRVPLIKKLVHYKVLVSADAILQLTRLRITPSIVLLLQKPHKGSPSPKKRSKQRAEEILEAFLKASEKVSFLEPYLLCPKHRIGIIYSKDRFICKKGCEYRIRNDILDFRYPPPEFINF